MRAILGSILVLSVVTLTACGKNGIGKKNNQNGGNEPTVETAVAVGPDGRCTDIFVQDLNKLYDEVNQLDPASDGATKAQVKNSCDAFFAKYGEVSCQTVRANKLIALETKVIYGNCISVTNQ